MNINNFFNYGILSIAYKNNIDYNELIQNDSENLRISLDGNYFVVNWLKNENNTIPNSIAPYLIDNKVYTWEEILQEMDSENWLKILDMNLL
jgi:hypothetical protein